MFFIAVILRCKPNSLLNSFGSTDGCLNKSIGMDKAANKSPDPVMTMLVLLVSFLLNWENSMPVAANTESGDRRVFVTKYVLDFAKSGRKLKNCGITPLPAAILNLFVA